VKTHVLRLLALSVCSMLLVACGGGGEDSGPPMPTTYSLAVTFTGLPVNGVTMQNNGGGGVAIPPNSTAAVTIATGLASGTAYSLTLSFVPAGWACGPVMAGANAGTIGSANLTIAYSCAQTYNVSVDVAGTLPSGLQLRLFPLLGNTTAPFNLAPTAGGMYTFGAQVRGDITYSIGIIAQPAGQTCLFGNNATTVSGAMNNQAQLLGVVCRVTLGGTVSGLASGGLILEMYDGDAVQTLNVASGSTSFTFAAPIVAGNDYSVGIRAVPAGLACTVVLGKGTTSPLTGVYTIAPGATAPNTGRYYLAFWADGTYAFARQGTDPSCNYVVSGVTLGNNGNGVEYGVYNYNSGTSAFSIVNAVMDSNGSCGLVDSDPTHSNANFSGTLTRSGNTLTLNGTVVATAVDSTPSSIVGAFIPQANNGQFVAFHSNLSYVVIETQVGALGPPRQERGCYAVSSGQLTLSVAAGCTPDGLAAYDYNGDSGLIRSGQTSGGPIPVSITGANSLQFDDTLLMRQVPN
jgi:hypothetical protein